MFTGKQRNLPQGTYACPRHPETAITTHIHSTGAWCGCGRMLQPVT